MCIRIAIKHPDMRIYGISDLYNFTDFHDGFSRPYLGNGPQINIRYMVSRMEIRVMDNLSAFNPIDATPQLNIQEKIKSIEDFMIFRPLDKAKELIVAPHEVNELMDMILKNQDPKQKEIREKKRKEWWQFTREINEGTIVNLEERIEPRNDIVAQLVCVR